MRDPAQYTHAGICTSGGGHASPTFLMFRLPCSVALMLFLRCAGMLASSASPANSVPAMLGHASKRPQPSLQQAVRSLAIPAARPQKIQIEPCPGVEPPPLLWGEEMPPAARRNEHGKPAVTEPTFHKPGAYGWMAAVTIQMNTNACHSHPTSTLGSFVAQQLGLCRPC